MTVFYFLFFKEFLPTFHSFKSGFSKSLSFSVAMEDATWGNLRALPHHGNERVREADHAPVGPGIVLASISQKRSLIVSSKENATWFFTLFIEALELDPAISSSS